MQLVSNTTVSDSTRCQPKESFSTLHRAGHHIICHSGSCELVPPLVSAPVVLLVDSLGPALFLTVLGSNMFLNEKYYMPTLKRMFKILDPRRTEIHNLNGANGEVRGKI